MSQCNLPCCRVINQLTRSKTDTLESAAWFALFCDCCKRGLVLVCFVFGRAVVRKTVGPEPLCAFPAVFGEPGRFHFAAAQMANQEKFGDGGGREGAGDEVFGGVSVDCVGALGSAFSAGSYTVAQY